MPYEVVSAILWPTVSGMPGHFEYYSNSFAYMDTPDCNPDFVQIEIERLHQMLKRNDTVRSCCCPAAHCPVRSVAFGQPGCQLHVGLSCHPASCVWPRFWPHTSATVVWPLLQTGLTGPACVMCHTCRLNT